MVMVRRQGWRGRVDEIREVEKVIQEHSQEMSPWEKRVMKEELENRRTNNLAVIQAGVLGEFNAAVAKLEAARLAKGAAVKSEALRFDDFKMSAAVARIQQLVQLALARSVNPMMGEIGPSKALAAIYSEAAGSDDIHKRRAADEVFQALSVDAGHVPDRDERMAVNQLSKKAEADLAELRLTDSMEIADENVKAAMAELSAKGPELDEVHQLFSPGLPISNVYATGPLAAAYKRILVHPDGELEILSPMDERVTGVMPVKEI